MNSSKLSEHDIQNVLRELPKVELSYEKYAHKKVHNANFIFAIPEGKKCFAWFSTYKNKNVCYILQIAENKKICNVYFALTSFASCLSHGTLLYGTTFMHSNAALRTPFFSVEDVLYYKGEMVSKTTFEKLELCKFMFENELGQNSFSKKQLVFGLPIVYDNGDNQSHIKIIHLAETLPYKIKYLQYRFNNPREAIYNVEYFKNGSQYQDTSHSRTRNENVNRTPKKSNLCEAVFNVTPDIQNDIYNLFIYENGKEVLYDTAFIPDYKTSIFMNKLFRIIKENANLDALEESDDEEEFENERIDKFVFLDKSYKMHCIYNFKFKKWVPIKLANRGDRLVNRHQL
jgi:hypothetical protein